MRPAIWPSSPASPWSTVTWNATSCHAQRPGTRPPNHVNQPEGVDRERHVRVHCPRKAIVPSGNQPPSSNPNRLTGDTTVPKAAMCLPFGNTVVPVVVSMSIDARHGPTDNQPVNVTDLAMADLAAEMARLTRRTQNLEDARPRCRTVVRMDLADVEAAFSRGNNREMWDVSSNDEASVITSALVHTVTCLHLGCMVGRRERHSDQLTG